MRRRDGRPYRRRKLLCVGERFRLYRDEVPMPGGKVVLREWAQRPSISAIVALPGKGRMLLVRQYRYGINQHLWEIPAGMVLKGESSLACARRECEEETGFRPVRMKSMGCFAPTPAFADEWVFLYTAYPLIKTRMNQDDDEDITVRIFTDSQVMRMLKGGVIRDAKSIIALTRFFGRRL